MNGSQYVLINAKEVPNISIKTNTKINFPAKTIPLKNTAQQNFGNEKLTSGIGAKPSQELKADISFTVHCSRVDLKYLCPALQIRKAKLNLTI